MAADRKLEREANDFAPEPLMPESALREALEDLGEMDACASHFAVARMAMHWRLDRFGLTSRPEEPDATL